MIIRVKRYATSDISKIGELWTISIQILYFQPNLNNLVYYYALHGLWFTQHKNMKFLSRLFAYLSYEMTKKTG